MKTVDEWFKETTGFDLKGHWTERDTRRSYNAGLKEGLSNNRECPTCKGAGEYLSDDVGTGMVKCMLCRATGKI